MIEENAVHRVQAVAFAGVDRHPVAVEFGAAVRAARVEGRGFGLRTFIGLAKHFAAGGVVKAGRDAGLADGFEEASGAERGDVSRVFGDIEADADVALRAEVVDFVGRDR